MQGNTFSGRLYCTPKALWKLDWFLRDFGYDTELLGHDEVDEKHLVGLSGVVKISHAGSQRHFAAQPRRLCPGRASGKNCGMPRRLNLVGPEAA